MERGKHAKSINKNKCSRYFFNRTLSFSPTQDPILKMVLTSGAPDSTEVVCLNPWVAPFERATLTKLD